MQVEVLYAVISFLGLAVLTLGGLWVRSHDKHREWSTTEISGLKQATGILTATHAELKDDIKEIKTMLTHHLEVEERFQKSVVQSLEKK